MQARESKAAVAAAYWPIIRGYLIAMAIYYALMTVANVATTSGSDLLFFAGSSGLSAVTLWLAFRSLKHRQHWESLVLANILVNTIILFNVEVTLWLDFSSSKLVYYIIAVMIFALASLSVRQSMLWISITLGLLAYKLAFQASELGFTFAFLGFAAAMAGATISHYLRKAIGSAAEAEKAAQLALQSVERDLDDEKTAGLALKQESLSDSLTGLDNRRAFFRSLEREIAAERTGWLALLDLDGFKFVNDNHGHIMGDELLKSVSFRLRSFCEGKADVSRIGGDEFGLVVSSDRAEDEVVAWMEQLLSRLSKAYPIDGRLIQISGSIGCCRIEQGQEESAVFKSADFALLHAKRSGKDRVVSFDDEHARAFAERYRIERALRAAKLTEEIELVFQPQLDLRTHTMVRAEVLARWNSPTLGLISPDDFISVAEDCGLMMDITVTVLRKAIETFKTWDEPIPLSVNLSATDLNSPQTMDAVLAVLESSDVDPSMIEFEVTESAMLVDMERATEHLERLAARGHTIAIDDFGTGYSNFNYLRALPINKLKIDRSFLEDLQDPMTEKILRSLVSVAGTLGVECLLEGVEDQLGLLMAKRTGVELVQGFLIGRPAGANEFRLSPPDEQQA
ncbi:MAG: EAL domain-containing protein [Pseudomonadota bacterium]